MRGHTGDARASKDIPEAENRGEFSDFFPNINIEEHQT
jgi:hypothetical protein